MEKLFVIKIGGNIIDEDAKLESFLQEYASIEGKKRCEYPKNCNHGVRGLYQ
jgi:hypothetical protein